MTNSARRSPSSREGCHCDEQAVVAHQHRENKCFSAISRGNSSRSSRRRQIWARSIPDPMLLAQRLERRNVADRAVSRAATPAPATFSARARSSCSHSARVLKENPADRFFGPWVIRGLHYRTTVAEDARTQFDSLGRIRSRSADETEPTKEPAGGDGVSRRNSRGTFSRTCMSDDLAESLAPAKNRPNSRDFAGRATRA